MVKYRSTFSLIAAREPTTDLKIAFSSDCDTLNNHCSLAPNKMVTWNLDAFDATIALLKLAKPEISLSVDTIFDVMHGIFHYNAHLWCKSKSARIPFAHEANKTFMLPGNEYEFIKAKLILIMFGPLEQYEIYTFQPKYPAIAQLNESRFAQKYVIDIVKGLATMEGELGQAPQICSPKVTTQEIKIPSFDLLNKPIVFNAKDPPFSCLFSLTSPKKEENSDMSMNPE